MDLPCVNLRRIEELRRQYDVCGCRPGRFHQVSHCHANYGARCEHPEEAREVIGNKESCFHHHPLENTYFDVGGRCPDSRGRNYCGKELESRVRSQILSHQDLGRTQYKYCDQTSKMETNKREPLSCFLPQKCSFGLCGCSEECLQELRLARNMGEFSQGYKDSNWNKNQGFASEKSMDCFCNNNENNCSDTDCNTENEFLEEDNSKHFPKISCRKVLPDETPDSEDDMEITINRNNRKILLLAINWISLSGEHNKHIRKFIADSMESCELINVPHFVILFQYDDHKGVRGMYTYSKENKKWYCVIEITSKCPRVIQREMIHTLYKFDTCQKVFKPIKQLKKITDIVDGLSIKNEYLIAKT